MAWTLARNGDSVERALGPDVCRLFPNYEKFWILHIVPLTYRVMDPDCIFVRAKVRPDLEDMATAHYGVLTHLAACHQQLNNRPDPDLFAVEGVYTFYSRLYSVHEAAVDAFLPATNEIIERYSRRHLRADLDTKGNPKKGTWRHQTRLETNGRRGLHSDLRDAFRRANKYRHQRVHWWGIPARSGKVPGPAYIDAWIRKGLGELARATETRIMNEFVDALPQARNDLESIERVLNEVWEMVLNELADFKNAQSQKVYAKVQNPTRRETIPSWWKPKDPLSSAAFETSGVAR